MKAKPKYLLSAVILAILSDLHSATQSVLLKRQLKSDKYVLQNRLLIFHHSQASIYLTSIVFMIKNSVAYSEAYIHLHSGNFLIDWNGELKYYQSK